MSVAIRRGPAYRLLLVLGLLLGSLAAFPAAVGATNYVVTECGDGGGADTLRGRIVAANADTNVPHLITFDFAAACPTITLASGELGLTRDMTIQGPGAGALTVSGGSASRVFSVASGVTATISGLTIADGTPSFGNGGGIHNGGTLTVLDSVIADSTASEGGGIYNAAGGVLIVMNSTVDGNRGASVSGGGLYNAGQATFTNSILIDNVAQWDGGGVYNHGNGVLHVTNSTFEGNTATTFYGGGLYNEGQATFTSSTLVDNTAGYDGGGIYSYTGTLDVTSTTFDGNRALTFYGGGLHNEAQATISDSTFVDNTASRDGGGIYNDNHGTLDVTSTTFDGNSAVADYGGGLYNEGQATISNSTVSGNDAGEEGGGIYNGSSGTLDVTNSTITGNSAEYGAVIENNGSATVTATLLVANEDDNCGGGTALTSGGHNLSDDDSCGLTGVGDLDNNPNANLDPTLADNGGPTLTHALLEPSDAIDHIPSGDCVVTEDQRGAGRPQGDGCEIGAFEVGEIYVQTYYQACLFAGALSQVRDSGVGEAYQPLSCGRGEEVILLAGGNPQFNTFEDDLHACLYAGALSQVNADGPPANCGRGEAISLTAGTDLEGCLYAGRLSQMSYSPPSSCGRGVPVGLALPTNPT